MGRDKYARATEVSSSVVAGTVGTGLAAEKLRDAYKRDYPKKYKQGAAVAERTAGELAPRAGRVARLASRGHVGFVPLAVGTGAAVTAAGAKRYRKRRALQEAAQHPVAKSAFGVDHIVKGSVFAEAGASLTGAASSADDRVRRLKRKTVPTVPQLVARAGDKTRTFVTAEQTKLAKAHDPDRAVRRHERAAEGVLGGGATAAAIGSVRATNAGRGHLKAAGTSAAARDRNFAFGRRSMGSHVDHLEATAKAKKQRKAVPVGRLEDSARDARYVRGKFAAGQADHAASVRSAVHAGDSFRHARNLRVAAAGLGLGAYAAHRRASGHDR